VPTIHDVAREAGVSARTVSRVLNEATNVRHETRHMVLQVAERMEYRLDPVARALKSGRKRVIGMVVNTVSSDATQRRIEVVSKLFNAAGYAILVQYADTSQIEEAAVREIAARCDALVVFTNMRQATSPVFESLKTTNYPFILVDPPSQVSYPAIYLDRRSAYRETVTYLVRKNRTRLILLVEEFRSDERREGFREGLAGMGLPFDARMVLHTAKGYGGGKSAATALAKLFTAGQADAVICHNDKIALGLISGLADQGIRVPQDMAVVGFDNDAYSAFVSPPLTTVAQGGDDQGGGYVGGGDVGAYIFEQVRNKLEYSTSIEGKTFGTSMIIRASA